MLDSKWSFIAMIYFINWKFVRRKCLTWFIFFFGGKTCGKALRKFIGKIYGNAIELLLLLLFLTVCGSSSKSLPHWKLSHDSIKGNFLKIFISQSIESTIKKISQKQFRLINSETSRQIQNSWIICQQQQFANHSSHRKFIKSFLNIWIYFLYKQQIFIIRTNLETYIFHVGKSWTVEFSRLLEKIENFQLGNTIRFSFLFFLSNNVKIFLKH